MRTTLTIEEHLARELKRIANRTGKPFKQVVNDTLQAGLRNLDAGPKPKRYRLRSVSLGKVRPGVNLDKASALADSLEDQEIIRRIELRK
jgi:hypothetical protein